MDCNSSENKATLVFATNNAHKLEEVRDIIGDRFEIKSLDDIGCHDDIPETADTLQGNALQKARYIKDKFGYDCFADDTGLICSALNGEPGVRSARYANDNDHEHGSEANMKLLLKNLSDKNDRSAYFMTVIALIYQGQTYTFNGVVNGVISHEKHGDGGFGYDPIFYLPEYGKTSAEISPEEKMRSVTEEKHSERWQSI